MERRKRGIYPSRLQKKKLFEIANKHPMLLDCKGNKQSTEVTEVWQTIAKECNAIPGARKTWRQWRKTWQDSRSKQKKRLSKLDHEDLPISVMLSAEEQEALGIKKVSSTTSCQASTEYTTADLLCDIDEPNMEFSEPESPIDTKVFTCTIEQTAKQTNKNNTNSYEHSSNCYFNCDVLAVQEQRKIQMKEDYFSFKKNYMKQKLKLLKEQTAALKTIVERLSLADDEAGK